MLRLSLEADDDERAELPLRQGRGIPLIEEALEPLPLSATARRRLAIAIRSVTGIESLVWLTDIAGLSRPAAVKLMRANARALLDAAIADLPTT
jgi:hypothetical protein